jgi:hypothetical protein
MSEMEDFLKRAGAYLPNGQLRLDRVQGSTGQWFLSPVDADGMAVTFWGRPEPVFISEDCFRDEDGNVLMRIVFMHDGSSTTSPVDASLRPTISVSALVTREGGTTSANPGGWPLTTEELDRIDRNEKPELPDDIPEWERRSLEGVARDDLGRLLTTRVKAADGQWVDVLMMENGEPQRFELDFGLIESREPSGQISTVTTARVAKGRVIVTLDEQGRPTLGSQSLNERMEKS